ncbi:MAG: SDR family NAD(P)-dependent oxidoreductase, partial [Bacteroidales bacterium]
MSELDALFDLKGKVAIVTGGGDGIGKGSCEILAKAGAYIVVSDLSLEKAQAVADEIIKDGGKAIAVPCNVLKDEDLVALTEAAVK